MYDISLRLRFQLSTRLVSLCIAGFEPAANHGSRHEVSDFHRR